MSVTFSLLCLACAGVQEKKTGHENNKILHVNISRTDREFVTQSLKIRENSPIFEIFNEILKKSLSDRGSALLGLLQY